MRKLWLESCNLGRATENDGGQEVRVHDMRKVWSPYDQSCILGEAASKKVGRGEHDPLAQLFYWLVIGHRGSPVSPCRGHGFPAHHHFQQRYPNYMTGNRGTTHSSFHGRPPPKDTTLQRHTSEELLSHLGHCQATPAGAAPRQGCKSSCIEEWYICIFHLHMLSLC